ncbi:MAG: hypothetical protein HUK26_07920 [Duodenibacillus sp.]|nr:hypothetical protein [Duodenibacillus sp.]
MPQDASEPAQDAGRLALYRGAIAQAAVSHNVSAEALERLIAADPGAGAVRSALAVLWRERGDFSRAIAVHEELAAAGGEEGARALAELARDFLAAGAYDMAEDALRRLMEIPAERPGAMRALIGVYCTERCWRRAVELARQFSAETGRDMTAEVVHFLCEIAEGLARRKDAAGAKAAIDEALAVNDKSPRALAAAADIALLLGDANAASNYWMVLELVRPDYSPIIAAKKSELVAQQSAALAVNYLKDVYERTGSLAALRRAALMQQKARGPEAALILASEAMDARPSMGAHALMCEVAARASPDDKCAATLARLVGSQEVAAGRYRCLHCGFPVRAFAWQCPGCERWDAFPPVPA